MTKLIENYSVDNRCNLGLVSTTEKMTGTQFARFKLLFWKRDVQFIAFNHCHATTADMQAFHYTSIKGIRNYQYESFTEIIDISDVTIFVPQRSKLTLALEYARSLHRRIVVIDSRGKIKREGVWPFPSVSAPSVLKRQGKEVSE